VSNRWIAAAALLVVGVMAVPAVARSDDEEPNDAPNKAQAQPSLELGIRTGYAILLGDRTPAYSPAHEMFGAVPLIVELAVRSISKRLAIGAMFQYGFGQLREPRSNGCGTDGVSCSASTTHLSLEALYFPAPDSGFSPWLGVGTGYEWVNLDVAITGTPVSAGTNGLEFLILQAGGDFRASSWFAIGPFLTFSVGRYIDQAVTSGGFAADRPSEGTDHSLHAWLTFGIRAVFGG